MLTGREGLAPAGGALAALLARRPRLGLTLRLGGLRGARRTGASGRRSVPATVAAAAAPLFALARSMRGAGDVGDRDRRDVLADQRVRSPATKRPSSGVARVKARPSRPARPVRPMR